MVDFLKKYEKSSMVNSILLILISIFLIIKPEIALNTIAIIFGVIFIIESIINIFSYFRYEKEMRIYSNQIINGIFCGIAGILILFNKEMFISIIPIVIGTWIIIKSIVKFQIALNINATMDKNWILILISSIITLVLGITIVINPFEAIFVITMSIGIIILVTEIIDLIESTYILFKIK